MKYSLNLGSLASQESAENSKGCSSTTCSESPTGKRKKNQLLSYVELDTLGSGSFGRVVKVQKKSNGQQYAMKVIEKKKMEEVIVISFTTNLPKFLFFTDANFFL